MMRSFLAASALASFMLQIASAPQKPAAPTPHHEANFDAEQKQADELYQAKKTLEALPLYEDLCRQDPTVGLFAERHGAGLLAKEDALTDPKEKFNLHIAAINELKRARSLGDDSVYVRTMLNADSKTLPGAIIAGIPLTVGYTYHGTPEAQKIFHDAEAAFGKADFADAAKLYVQAAGLDPAWYDAALYAGDSYFRMKDEPDAAAWFKKAILIDPDRETAYRYWGDAIFQSGDPLGAREKFVAAVVAEPYGIPAIHELGEWAKLTRHQLIRPDITRPNFTTYYGKLTIDPALEASTQDGRSSWIVYQQYRVDHGALTLNQAILSGGSDQNAVVTTREYRHTIAEEHAALRAMLKDIDDKIKAGTLQEEKLDLNIRNIRSLEKEDCLGAWIAFAAADAGIRSDYPQYRSNHRKHLADYINEYGIR